MSNISQTRKAFNDKYSELNDLEISKEILFAQQIQIDKLDKIRSNTSILVWWLVALPVLFGIIAILFAIGIGKGI